MNALKTSHKSAASSLPPLTAIFENQLGVISRVLHGVSDSVYVVFHETTHRVEFVDKSTYTAMVKAQKSIQLIKEIQFTDEHTTVRIPKVGQIKWSRDFQIHKDPIQTEDDQKQLINAFRWSYAAGFIFVALLLITGFIARKFQKPEQEVVAVVDRKEVERILRKMPEPEQEVAPLPQKVVASSKPVKVAPQKSKIQTVRTSKSAPKSQVAVNQMGALGVLGQLENSQQRGGLQLNKAGVSAGVGRGGSGGSGGVQTSIYAKGLVAAPLGEGNVANGGGGYKTKGKGGGGSAGYGKISMVGSSGAYFHPVESDAIIEGGLDRATIAAVIARHQGEIRYCYEQSLQTEPQLAGRISVKFEIAASGSVSTAFVQSSSIRSSSVEGCVISHLKTWKFPRPKGGVTVKVMYPFMFNRVSES